MKFDIPAMWCELTTKIHKIKAGATPAQAAQINENRQNIAILYGVTESIQDLIPEDTSVNNPLVNDSDLDSLETAINNIEEVIPSGASTSDPLVKASQIPGLDSKVVNIPSSYTQAQMLDFLYSQIDGSKITVNSRMRFNYSSGYIEYFCGRIQKYNNQYWYDFIKTNSFDSGVGWFLIMFAPTVRNTVSNSIELQNGTVHTYVTQNPSIALGIPESVTIYY